MTFYFKKEMPKICYGPEVMHYPTFIGINEDGEVEFEDDDVKPVITDYCDYEEKPSKHGTPYAHVEHGIDNPWRHPIRLGYGPDHNGGDE
jgi:hypothetical protein